MDKRHYLRLQGILLWTLTGASLLGLCAGLTVLLFIRWHFVVYIPLSIIGVCGISLVLIYQFVNGTLHQEVQVADLHHEQVLKQNMQSLISQEEVKCKKLAEEKEQLAQNLKNQMETFQQNMEEEANKSCAAVLGRVRHEVQSMGLLLKGVLPEIPASAQSVQKRLTRVSSGLTDLAMRLKG